MHHYKRNSRPNSKVGPSSGPLEPPSNHCFTVYTTEQMSLLNESIPFYLSRVEPALKTTCL